MRFVTYEEEGRPALGLRTGESLVPLATLDRSLPRTLEDLLALGPDTLAALARAASSARARRSPEGLKWLPPLTRPGKVLCVGLNYVEHAAESPYKEAPQYPVLFGRYPQSFVGHETPIVRPRVSTRLDYEGELVAVIGTGGRHIARHEALRHVAGYTIFNDGSVRDYQFRTPQWLVGKNFDASGACGPELVTADELPPGCAGLRLRTRVNGRTMQDANTRDMIFDVAALVAACSEVMALHPGDMIVTGTPAGIGAARKPPVYLQPGDVCEVEIEGIGTLRNPVVDEA